MISSRLRLATLCLGLAVSLSGCSLFKSSSAPDDSIIVAQIQSKLYQDPALKNRDIRVISQKGVVVLSGTVSSEEEKNSVEHFAQAANGVQQVIDQLAISSTVAAAQPPESAPPEPRRKQRRSRQAAAENEVPPEQPGSQAVANPSPAPILRAADASAPAPNVPPPPPPPPKPVVLRVPAGTVITVRTIDSIDSSVSRPGDEFAATVDSPVVVGDRVLVPRYADARLRLVSAQTSGRIKGQSNLQVALVSLTAGGKTCLVDSGVYQVQGASRGKRSAKVIGGGAGLGALIGAIAGGGKGAAIGAAVGAGGGTAVEASSKGEQVKIPAETKVDFTLRSPLTVTLPPQGNDQPQQN